MCLCVHFLPHDRKCVSKVSAIYTHSSNESKHLLIPFCSPGTALGNESNLTGFCLTCLGCKDSEPSSSLTVSVVCVLDHELLVPEIGPSSTALVKFMAHFMKSTSYCSQFSVLICVFFPYIWLMSLLPLVRWKYWHLYPSFPLLLCTYSINTIR